ncbi:MULTISPECIES: zinc-dependent alcohol dehydrogenase [Mycolicibacterium]|uniref:Alcohol dehydrogenase GroES domain protein n=2 Tax=Mycolicibacterium TaxID=1866885 RepID=A1TEC2_MYCVP|nr:MULTISPECIES: zinc-dependent alcohol dehydrogenase [Mycolicibacterium]ABM15522.1 Alcohol dehydrogenase GroES domain protein [Mycolicibacterium vanbaalenii PYR-1]MCV7130920.1 glutathione-dependent formaldehyde dehydrogenase [Mycolicibacterium vanbaalenii PYR-1]MDN4522192.1 zinc-dependent alcohol dehydrogenase [Mycolicibacterium austroafricanum]QRZ05792.1 glutathione-dependent formaldehyde dehydrogenase [Mycolicibacterium austroafricanum]QZT67348.1 glutathione-dependent formaldehyde dehydroge
MRAVTWHGRRDVRVDSVPDPKIEEPTDAIIEVTSTNICGSDLHLYEVLGAFMNEGDILGHEPMGVVREVGSAVSNLAVGDRVVIPFQISCGHCFMCDRKLYTQCETTQVRDQGMGAALFGYSELYGSVPGGQAEYLRVPQAQFTHIKVPDGPPDSRFVYLSDVLPTAWQAVAYADVPDGGTVTVLGLGPIGDMAARIAQHLGYQVFAVDLVPERLDRAIARGIHTIDASIVDGSVGDEVRRLTGGRGSDSVIDAVGMEAHGSPVAKFAQQATALLPDAVAKPMMQKAGVDRLDALYTAIDCVRRGGTLSLIGVYGGMADPMPMLTLFDKQIQVRMGQANVKKWVDDIMPLLTDSDPLGVDTFATHVLPMEEAPHAYKIFQQKQDGAVKVILQP